MTYIVKQEMMQGGIAVAQLLIVHRSPFLVNMVSLLSFFFKPDNQNRICEFPNPVEFISHVDFGKTG